MEEHGQRILARKTKMEHKNINMRGSQNEFTHENGTPKSRYAGFRKQKKKYSHTKRIHTQKIHTRTGHKNVDMRTLKRPKTKRKAYNSKTKRKADNSKAKQRRRMWSLLREFPLNYSSCPRSEGSRLCASTPRGTMPCLQGYKPRRTRHQEIYLQDSIKKHPEVFFLGIHASLLNAKANAHDERNKLASSSTECINRPESS